MVWNAVLCTTVPSLLHFLRRRRSKSSPKDAKTGADALKKVDVCTALVCVSTMIYICLMWWTGSFYRTFHQEIQLILRFSGHFPSIS